MKKMLKSKEGITPILATLLLIVIAVAAVIVTYAWVMTFTTSQTEKSGEFLAVPNIDWSNSSQIAIDIINSGIADAKIIKVYFGTSSTGLTETLASYSPSSTVPKDGASIVTVTIVVSGNWTSNTRYYFKFLTQAGNTWEHNEVSD